MSTKIKIKNSGEEFEVPRGSSVPREGETLVITEKDGITESLYQVYMVEHMMNKNSRMPIINTLITVDEIKKVE